MRRQSWQLLILICTTSVFFGCKMTSFVDQTVPWHQLPLAIPFQPQLQQEIKLAKIDQLLLRTDLTEENRARLYFERGLVNDRLGLKEIAHFDFKRSLSFVPAQTDIFNILGIYFTQSQMYDAAYEAFDSALELDEKNHFAKRNRGISLYYGGRYKLAHRDLLKHYKDDINDPYRSIWLYLLEIEIYDLEQAKKNLASRYMKSDMKDWGWKIPMLYLDEINEKQLFLAIEKESQNNSELLARLTETYFYLAKRYQAQGKLDSAIALYKLVLATNMYDFIEHRYATLELNKIAELNNIVSTDRS